MRAAIFAVIVSALAIVLHRVELVVLAAPFAVWSGIGWCRQRAAGSEPVATVSTRRLTVGEAVDYRVSVPGGGASVALHLPPPPNCEVEPPFALSVGLGSAVVRMRPMRWGRHTLRPLDCDVTDAWGMWSGRWRPAPETVTVTPELDPPGRGDGIPHPIGMVGVHASRSRGDGGDLAEIRTFTTGDRLRRINWRVTSRTGTLHTNATTADRDTEVLVVVDSLDDVGDKWSDSPEHTTSNSSMDITIPAAATIADHYLRLGDRVGLHDLGPVAGSIRSGTGNRQRGIIIDQLAKSRSDHELTHGLRHIGRIRPGTLVLCCTPLLAPEVVDEIVRLLHRGATVLIIDTLPDGLGRLNSVPPLPAWRDRINDRVRSRRFWPEAWVLRRMQRDRVVTKLNQLGVPVVAWHGIDSLAQMVTALAASRSAPRLTRR